jgi:1-pyrroline-5-carboxylate dehydrogenase
MMLNIFKNNGKRGLILNTFKNILACRNLSKVPAAYNQKMLDYAPGNKERYTLERSLQELLQNPVNIPGKGESKVQTMPSDHQHVICNYYHADLDESVEKVLGAKETWAAMSFQDRAAIFLKAADLLDTKYRDKIMAATMLGQGKTVWQAEIDAHAELVDFLRFNVEFAEKIYAEQPPKNDNGIWNRTDWRPLEGFVAAIAPFNFTAISGNLVASPVLMGNVCVWKPASSAVLSSYVIKQAFDDAGMPEGVVELCPSSGRDFAAKVLAHPELGGVHFTGSTRTFRTIWKQVSDNLENYRGYPRLVGETGGKNMHFVHSSADPKQVALNTLRSAFEYQGQKCSACSRMYVPESLWPEIRDRMVQGIKHITENQMGQSHDFRNFMSAVIDKGAFDDHVHYLDEVIPIDPDCTVLTGGTYDRSVGYFVHPTLVETTNHKSPTMQEEIFGPILTVYVYPDNEFAETLALADETSDYALTGSIFAKDRAAVIQAASSRLVGGERVGPTTRLVLS